MMTKCNYCGRDIEYGASVCPYCGMTPSAYSNSMPAVNIDSMMMRVYLFIENGDILSAQQYCDEILRYQPDKAEAYLCKLMCEYGVRTKEMLREQPRLLDMSPTYHKILSLGESDVKEFVESANQEIRLRHASARAEGMYSNATALMNSANSAEDFKRAAFAFSDIAGYRDSKQLSDDCFKRSEELRREEVYYRAKSAIMGGDPAALSASAAELATIRDFRDAEDLLGICLEKAKRLSAVAENDRQRTEFEIAASKKRGKKLLVILLSTVAALILVAGGVLATIFYFIPESNYTSAVKLMKDGDYSGAIEVFTALEGYKDSESKIKECVVSCIGVSRHVDISTANAGDVVEFGTYMQSAGENEGEFVTEPIQWIVLSTKNNRALLISKYALDGVAFDSEDSASWEGSELRAWLNDSFYNTAFDENERQVLRATSLEAEKNIYSGVVVGDSTKDKVFLMSDKEARDRFVDDPARGCRPTDYAMSRNVWADDENDGRCTWWLRTAGEDERKAAFVSASGEVYYDGVKTSSDRVGVRPVISIPLGE